MGKFGQPFGLDHGAIPFVLAITQHGHGGFPGIKIIRIPDLDAVVALLEHGLRRLTIKARAYGGCQQGKVLYEARYHRQADRVGSMQKGAVAYSPSPTTSTANRRPKVVDCAPQQALDGTGAGHTFKLPCLWEKRVLNFLIAPLTFIA